MTTDTLELKNPKTKEILLNDIAINKGRDVAKKYNVTDGRISQIKKANKELIEAKKQELLSQLPTVVDTVKTDLNTNNRLSKHIALDFTAANSDIVALKNSLDKTNLNILKIAGIIEPHKFNLISGKNIQINQNINPTIVKFIGASALQRLSEAEDNGEQDTD